MVSDYTVLVFFNDVVKAYIAKYVLIDIVFVDVN